MSHPTVSSFNAIKFNCCRKLISPTSHSSRPQQIRLPLPPRSAHFSSIKESRGAKNETALNDDDDAVIQGVERRDGLMFWPLIYLRNKKEEKKKPRKDVRSR